MSNPGRQYRREPSRPIPVWNGVLEHRRRIDAALWTFLWLLDAITKERDGAGIVLGGSPVKISRIAQDLEFDERTVREHLQTLEDGRYIKRRRTPYGYVIHVCNSRKFGIWKAHERSEGNTRSQTENGRNFPSDRKRTSDLIRSEETFRNKEDAAVTQQKDAAAKTALPFSSEETVWRFLGITPSGPPSFRSLLETRWETRNGQRRSALIGDAIDSWEVAEGGKLRAPALFQALSELRGLERGERQSTSPLEIVRLEVPA